MLGSGRNTTSRPCAAARGCTAEAKFALSATVFGANAVFGTTPSCNHWRHCRSNCDAAVAAGAAPACAVPVGAGAELAGPRFAVPAPVLEVVAVAADRVVAAPAAAVVAAPAGAVAAVAATAVATVPVPAAAPG